jgi:hypothetical protein
VDGKVRNEGSRGRRCQRTHGIGEQQNELWMYGGCMQAVARGWEGLIPKKNQVINVWTKVLKIRCFGLDKIRPRQK